MFADDLLLFGEATDIQINCVTRILTNFCRISGQEVSLEKTSIFFSRNVNRDTRSRLVQTSGFRETQCLGKYLEVPLTGRAPKKEDYRYIIDQVSAKLSAWKANQLSFAGRMTLAKSVLEAVPIYPMMTAIIPKSCIDEIHKMQRSFIWGESNNVRKYHAIGWNNVAKPKELGGLGLRRLNVMNKACILKLCWKLQAGSQELWSEVLWGKYKRNADLSEVRAKPSDSSLWKSIVKLWPAINEHCFWSLGDGKEVDAWTSAWIAPGFKIIDLNVQIPLEMHHYKVVDLVHDEDNWNWSLLNNWLHVNVLKQLESVFPPSNASGPDVKVGLGDGKSEFSVSMMYKLLMLEYFVIFQ
jgi:hypothetical protein